MASRLRRPYDARMLSRRPWIAAFIGHVLRRGHAVDPDSIFDTADEMYLDWRDSDPAIAADSAFGPTLAALAPSAQQGQSPTRQA